MMLLLHAQMTKASRNSSCWNMALHVPPLLRCCYLTFFHLCFYVNQFICCLLNVLPQYDVRMKYLHPKTAQITRNSNQNTPPPTHTHTHKTCRKNKGSSGMTVWLGCTWPEVELLLNGAVGCVSGQFESVSDSLMPLLEQRWGVVLSLAGCRRAENRTSACLL